jgi:hypothetical protein
MSELPRSGRGGQRLTTVTCTHTHRCRCRWRFAKPRAVSWPTSNAAKQPCAGMVACDVNREHCPANRQCAALPITDATSLPPTHMSPRLFHHRCRPTAQGSTALSFATTQPRGKPSLTARLQYLIQHFDHIAIANEIVIGLRDPETNQDTTQHEHTS